MLHPVIDGQQSSEEGKSHSKTSTWHNTESQTAGR